MNPYHKFLDLPEAETQPDYYGLLGVPRFTDDVKQIHAAAVTRGQQLRDWDNSKFYLEANTVLDEVAHASLVLEDPIRKAAYDAELRQTLGIVSRPNPIPSTNEIVATSPPKRVSKGLVSPQPTPSDKPADVVYALEPSLVRPKNIEELFLRRRSSGRRVFAASSVGVCVAALLGMTWAMRSGRTVSSAISSPVTATSTNQVAPTPVSLSLSPLTTVTLQAGDRRRVAVQVNRTACQGATLVRAQSLPAWLSAEPAVISAEESNGILELVAADSAADATVTIRIEATLAEMRAEQLFDVVVQSSEVRQWKGSGRRIISVATADDHLVLVGGADSTLHLWNADSGDEPTAISTGGEAVRSAALSSNGQLALFGGADGKLRMWSLAKPDAAQERHCLAGHEKFITSVALSASGHRAVSGSFDTTVRLWDMPAGTELHCFRGHTNTVTSVAISADGRWVLSGGDDKTVRLWNAESKSELWDVDQTARPERHTRSVTCVALSKDGQFALSGSLDRTVKLWNLRDLALTNVPLILRGHTAGVTSVAISPDARHILSGSEDQTVRLWDAQSGSELRRLSGHTAPVTSVAFTADGRYGVSGANDNTVRLWRLNVGEATAPPSSRQP